MTCGAVSGGEWCSNDVGSVRAAGNRAGDGGLAG